eukprot:1434642-Amphidinium_carterae.1
MIETRQTDDQIWQTSRDAPSLRATISTPSEPNARAILLCCMLRNLPSKDYPKPLTVMSLLLGDVPSPSLRVRRPLAFVAV